MAVLLPLWASYLAKVYAWLLIFTHDGLLNWALGRSASARPNLIYTNAAVFIVFCYIWLPFMIIPVYTALERIPASLIEASPDLGARTWRTTRQRAPAAGAARHRGRVDLHVLADARRLHHAAADRRERTRTSSAT